MPLQGITHTASEPSRMKENQSSQDTTITECTTLENLTINLNSNKASLTADIMNGSNRVISPEATPVLASDPSDTVVDSSVNAQSSTLAELNAETQWNPVLYKQTSSILSSYMSLKDREYSDFAAASHFMERSKTICAESGKVSPEVAQVCVELAQKALNEDHHPFAAVMMYCYAVDLNSSLADELKLKIVDAADKCVNSAAYYAVYGYTYICKIDKRLTVKMTNEIIKIANDSSKSGRYDDSVFAFATALNLLDWSPIVASDYIDQLVTASDKCLAASAGVSFSSYYAAYGYIEALNKDPARAPALIKKLENAISDLSQSNSPPDCSCAIRGYIKVLELSSPHRTNQDFIGKLIAVSNRALGLASKDHGDSLSCSAAVSGYVAVLGLDLNNPKLVSQCVNNLVKASDLCLNASYSFSPVYALEGYVLALKLDPKRASELAPKLEEARRRASRNGYYGYTSFEETRIRTIMPATEHSKASDGTENVLSVGINDLNANSPNANNAQLGSFEYDETGRASMQDITSDMSELLVSGLV